jgi:integrase/recombinase XerD
MLINIMDLSGFEPEASSMPRRKNRVDKSTVEEYINIKRLSGVSERHLYEVRRYLKHYLTYVSFNIDKRKSIEYLNLLQDKHTISSYRKITYQILKFLRHQKIEWAEEIRLPAEPTYYPKYVSKDDVKRTLILFKNHEHYLRFKALILLGINSGMRAEELYQLKEDDICLHKRTVFINHNPKFGQTTKTGKSRVSFFTKDTKHALETYLEYYNNGNNLKVLFPQKWLERAFNDKPIKVKHLRKYFSQEWDRRGGQTSIKKILMGHSLKGDVDLMHYNAQSPEDLKRIYDKVMNERQ